jgi:hypothetical protein
MPSALNIKLRTLIKRHVVRPRLEREDFEAARPFTSENTWRLLSEHCERIGRRPVILEYGSGMSTWYHLKNAAACGGGTVVAVEHDYEWYLKMTRSLRRIFGVELRHEELPLAMQGAEVRLRYLYRPGTGLTGCGTYEEFRDYVDAPSGQFDLIVVDGRARKACVRRALADDLLSDRGLLVLFEAGRGHPSWPHANQRGGTWDYQPEVKALLDRGGALVEGSGLDAWSDWRSPAAPHPCFGERYPMEACFYWRSPEDRPELTAPASVTSRAS